MLKLCHHVCLIALLKRIIEMFYQLYVIDIVDIVTFNQTLESVCDRKLRETHSNISAIND